MFRPILLALALLAPVSGGALASSNFALDYLSRDFGDLGACAKATLHFLDQAIAADDDVLIFDAACIGDLIPISSNAGLHGCMDLPAYRIDTDLQLEPWMSKNRRLMAVQESIHAQIDSLRGYCHERTAGLRPSLQDVQAAIREIQLASDSIRQYLARR